jgi:hypothetical protein
MGSTEIKRRAECSSLTLLCSTLFLALNWFSGKIFCYKYRRLYIGIGNLIVNVDEQHNLQRLTQNKTGSVLTTMTLWYNCVTIVDVEKQ